MQIGGLINWQLFLRYKDLPFVVLHRNGTYGILEDRQQVPPSVEYDCATYTLSDNCHQHLYSTFHCSTPFTSIALGLVSFCCWNMKPDLTGWVQAVNNLTWSTGTDRLALAQVDFCPVSQLIVLEEPRTPLPNDSSCNDVNLKSKDLAKLGSATP